MRGSVGNPLAAGFYTVQEAARLLRANSTRRIFGWLRGYPDRDVGPLLARDYQPLGEAEEVSFLDLMEIRFVEKFRAHGVKIRSLRGAADTLRRELKTPHPFAYEHVLIVADKVDVLVREALLNSAKEHDDFRLRSLLTKNYVMYEAIKQSLLPGVTFDTATEMASVWAPMPGEFPRIKANPKVAFGHPALPSGVPTGTLYDAFKAEKGNLDTVAYWFEQSSNDVLEAIRFEQMLDQPLERQAA